VQPKIGFNYTEEEFHLVSIINRFAATTKLLSNVIAALCKCVALAQRRTVYNVCVLSTLQALNNMLEDKNIKRPLNLVAHGFITGQYAATWALQNPDAIAKLVLIDVPYSPEVCCHIVLVRHLLTAYGNANARGN
jgi:pimeloyl-ACP methyl ester carboxylesterase